MIDSPYTKVGIAGFLLACVWALGLGIEHAGGNRVTELSAKEGVLMPEVPEEIPPLREDAPVKHNAMVAVSVPRVKSIDPGSVSVTTPGMSVEDAQIHPIIEFRKPTHPKPRSILLLLDNSRSMIPNELVPASDPNYRRLDASRLLLEALNDQTDRVSIASFPCRRSVEDFQTVRHPSRPYELLTFETNPKKAIPVLDKLRNEENGSTPLYRAIAEAAKTLGKSPADSQRILVILTDGIDSEQLPSDLRTAIDEEHVANVEAYAIGLGASADIDALKRFSNNVIRADDASALSTSFRQILQQMSREVVQIDLDVVVGRLGKPIAAGTPVELSFRSNGKLYSVKGKTK